MASGAQVVGFIKEMPPQTLYAQRDSRAGGSTPAESVDVYDFDAATIEYMDYLCLLHGYAGGGLTFSIKWSASSATSGTARWGIAIRRVADDAEDIDAAHTYDFNDVDAVTASASGEADYVNVTFTDGADMDSWAEGEIAVVRIRRNASHANDDMTGDAELIAVSAKET